MRLLRVNVTETLFKEIYFVTVAAAVIGYCLFGIRIFLKLQFDTETHINLRIKLTVTSVSHLRVKNSLAFGCLTV